MDRLLDVVELYHVIAATCSACIYARFTNSTIVCIGYYTPASAISVIHAPRPRAFGPRAGCNMVFISYGSHTAHTL